MLAIHADDRAFTGSAEISRRHGLSAGNSEQPATDGPPVTGGADARGAVADAARRVVADRGAISVVGTAEPAPGSAVVDESTGTVPCAAFTFGLAWVQAAASNASRTAPVTRRTRSARA
jgi:hypothetical protein